MYKSLIIFLSLVIGSLEYSYSSLSDMATKLSELRQEISSLEDKIRSQESSLNSEFKIFSMERAEIESKKRNIRKANESLRKEILSLEQQFPKSHFQDKAVVMTSLEALEQRVQTSLPFQKSERLKPIQDLKIEIEKGPMTNHVLTKWMRILSEENQLSSDISLFKKPVVFGGRSYHSEVLKLGMSVMYFRTPEGKWGGYVYKDGEWKAEPITSQSDIQDLKKLFASVRKNIHQGEFRVPVQKLQFQSFPSS